MVAIIDDDESVRLATASLVRSIGLTTNTFASAEEFLYSSQRDDAACLITDVQMPGMSGVELQAHLIKHGNDVPIIFMTAFPEERIRDQVCAAGAIGFLSKPFDGGMMIACIDKALQQGRNQAGEHTSRLSSDARA